MSGILAAALAAYGAHLLYTSFVLRWRGVGPGPSRPRQARERRRPADWLAQAGLGHVGVAEFAAVIGGVFLLGALVALTLFGAGIPALAGGVFAASFPVAAYRRRRTARRAVAQESWPRLIEELRILTSSVGRSIPQALFQVGDRDQRSCAPPSPPRNGSGSSPLTSNAASPCCATSSPIRRVMRPVRVHVTPASHAPGHRGEQPVRAASVALKFQNAWLAQVSSLSGI